MQKLTKKLTIVLSLTLSSLTFAGDKGDGGDYIWCEWDNNKKKGYLFLDYAVESETERQKWSKFDTEGAEFLNNIARSFSDDGKYGDFLQHVGLKGHGVQERFQSYAQMIERGHFFRTRGVRGLPALADEMLSNTDITNLTDMGCDSSDKLQGAIKFNGTYLFNEDFDRKATYNSRTLPNQNNIKHLHEMIRLVVTDASEIRKWVKLIYDKDVNSNEATSQSILEKAIEFEIMPADSTQLSEVSPNGEDLITTINRSSYNVPCLYESDLLNNGLGTLEEFTQRNGLEIQSCE